MDAPLTKLELHGLDLWMTDKGLSTEAAAKAIGTTRLSIHRWRNNHKPISKLFQSKLREKIKDYISRDRIADELDQAMKASDNARDEFMEDAKDFGSIIDGNDTVTRKDGVIVFSKTFFPSPAVDLMHAVGNHRHDPSSQEFAESLAKADAACPGLREPCEKWQNALDQVKELEILLSQIDAMTPEEINASKYKWGRSLGPARRETKSEIIERLQIRVSELEKENEELSRYKALAAALQALMTR